MPLLVTGARTCPAVLSATVPRSARGLRGAFSDEETQSYVETTELSKNIFGRLIEEDAKMTQAQESGVSRWDAARPLGDSGPSAARGALRSPVTAAALTWFSATWFSAPSGRAGRARLPGARRVPRPGTASWGGRGGSCEAEVGAGGSGCGCAARRRPPASRSRRGRPRPGPARGSAGGEEGPGSERRPSIHHMAGAPQKQPLRPRPGRQGREPGALAQPPPHGGHFSRILWEAEPPAAAAPAPGPAAPARDARAPPQL